MATIKKITQGAFLGTLLGSLALKLYPQRRKFINSLIDQTSEAKEYANQMLRQAGLSESKNYNKAGYIAGGVIGLLVGTGIALALAPKTGKQLRNQFNRAYQELLGNTENVIRTFKHDARSLHKMAVNGTRPRMTRKKATRTIKHKSV
jgi:gas vesicle protein